MCTPNARMKFLLVNLTQCGTTRGSSGITSYNQEMSERLSSVSTYRQVELDIPVQETFRATHGDDARCFFQTIRNKIRDMRHEKCESNVAVCKSHNPRSIALRRWLKFWTSVEWREMGQSFSMCMISPPPSFVILSAPPSLQRQALPHCRSRPANRWAGLVTATNFVVITDRPSCPAPANLRRLQKERQRAFENGGTTHGKRVLFFSPSAFQVSCSRSKSGHSVTPCQETISLSLSLELAKEEPLVALVAIYHSSEVLFSLFDYSPRLAGGSAGDEHQDEHQLGHRPSLTHGPWSWNILTNRMLFNRGRIKDNSGACCLSDVIHHIHGLYLTKWT